MVVSLGKQAYYTQIDLDQPKAYASAKERGYQVDPVVFDKEPDKAKEHLKWIHWVSSNIKRGLVPVLLITPQ